MLGQLRHGIERTAELVRAAPAATEVVDALLERAFQLTPVASPS